MLCAEGGLCNSDGEKMGSGLQMGAGTTNHSFSRKIFVLVKHWFPHCKMMLIFLTVVKRMNCLSV